MQLNGFPIERKKLSELTKAPYNPRKITPEQAKALQRSLTEFGTVEPIIWNKQTGHIVGGHQRLDALQSLGETETDVLIVDMPEEREQALNIALNKISGDWDNGMLSDVLLSLHEELRELTGFSEDEIAALLPKQEGLTDPDAIPEVVEPVAKLGDIWQLGEHRLMCGDSTDAGSVALLMNGERCDMVFTDPPYGMSLDTDFTSMVGLAKGNKYKKVIGDDTSYSPTHIFESFQSVKEIFLWGADYYAQEIPKRNDGCFFVWDKTGGAVGPNTNYDKMFGSNFELCWSKQKHKRAVVHILWKGIFGLSKEDTKNRVHPTQKPSELCSWFLDKFSKKEDIVCDLFLGSGSTLIACEQLNRKCYGMELDPHYCDVIIKRWEDFTGKKAVKVA